MRPLYGAALGRPCDECDSRLFVPLTLETVVARAGDQ